MLGRAILTRGEFQLMCAAVGAQALPGFVGLALQKDLPPQPADRDGLSSKGLLRAGEGGRFAVDPTVGYLFSHMADCTAWLRMDMAFTGGRATRKVLYLVDDGFVYVDWRGVNEIEYRYVMTIPQAMGMVLNSIRSASGSDLPHTDVLMDDQTALTVLDSSAGKGLDALAAVHLVTEGREAAIDFTEVGFAVDAKGDLYRAVRNGDSVDFNREPVEKLVESASESVLAAHRARIMAKQRS